MGGTGSELLLMEGLVSVVLNLYVLLSDRYAVDLIKTYRLLETVFDLVNI